MLDQRVVGDADPYKAEGTNFRQANAVGAAALCGPWGPGEGEPSLNGSPGRPHKCRKPISAQEPPAAVGLETHLRVQPTPGLPSRPQLVASFAGTTGMVHFRKGRDADPYKAEGGGRLPYGWQPKCNATFPLFYHTFSPISALFSRFLPLRTGSKYRIMIVYEIF